MKEILTYEEFLNEGSVSTRLSRWHLEGSIDGECGIFAATYKKAYPKSEIFGILDTTYRPSPTIQHYFVRDQNEFFDGSGVKTLKDFERLYKGVVIKINDEGLETGKTEDDYSDLPDFGVDKRFLQIMK